ncbi:MAG TPA: NTF2 fold immunity protein [Stellaceae bacterium]
MHKPGATILFLMQMQGGLVNTAELAVGIAALLCEAHYGKETLERQKRLVAADKGSYWCVEGSLHRDGKVQGRGHFFASIEKYDARVTDVGCYGRLGAESDAFVQRLVAAKTPEEKSKIFADYRATLENSDEKKT